MARKPISCYYAQISFSRKPRPPQCLLAWLARVPKVTPYKKNPRSVNVIVTFGTLSFAMCRRCGDYSVSAADDGTELSCVVTVPGLSPVTATAILSVRCKSTHYWLLSSSWHLFLSVAVSTVERCVIPRVTPCGLRGVMRPWFDFWFRPYVGYIVCLFVYISGALILFSSLFITYLIPFLSFPL